MADAMYSLIVGAVTPWPNTVAQRNCFFQVRPILTHEEWKAKFSIAPGALEPLLPAYKSEEVKQEPRRVWEWILLFEDVVEPLDQEVILGSKAALPAILPIPPKPRAHTNAELARRFQISIPESVGLLDITAHATGLVRAHGLKYGPGIQAQIAMAINELIRLERDSIPQFNVQLARAKQSQEYYAKAKAIKDKHVAVVKARADRVSAIKRAAQAWYREQIALSKIVSPGEVELTYG